MLTNEFSKSSSEPKNVLIFCNECGSHYYHMQTMMEGILKKQNAFVKRNQH